ncbi:MAG TPA: pitrilysin family protein [Allosphingosinicella sp.]|nr:pitrilysin family protein [Allosphingosinicella sp.]
MRKLAGIVIAAAAALVSPAAAQPSAPTGQPAIRALLQRTQIPYETFTLANGLRVVVHTDRKAPVVAIQAWYNVGSKDEPAGRTGFAHLFEHIGLFNGTENFRAGLIEPLRAMGATDWNGTTWFDRTNYFQTVPTPALEQALYMESDRMGHLLGALTQERLDAQRGVVQNEKRQNDNQPFGLVYYRMLEALFPEGHPYRHSTIGSMADLDAASLEDVRRWFRERYGPNNAVLVLAGDIDARTARRLVERYFGHIPRGPENRPAEAGVPTLAAPLSETMTDRVANTRLYRNWAVPGMLDEQSVALEVAASVFGGLASSRLDNALVRGDRSAVGVTASMTPFQRVGVFSIIVDVRPGADAAAVERRLDALIAEFIAEGPTEDEVRRAVMRAVSSTVFGMEQVGGFGGKAVALAQGTLLAGDPAFYQRRLAALASTTPAEVRAAAQRWLSRPVYALRVDPGERAAYQEAAGPARTAAAPAAEIAATPRGPVPPVGEVRDIDFPAIERARLSNGMRVTYVRRETVPTTLVGVDFDAGIAADPADRLGLQLLTASLLTEGTTSRNSIQIAEEQERLGAFVGTGVAVDRTIVTLSALTPNLGPSLDLLADVVMNPAFAPGEVERLRAQQLAGIAAERTSPTALARRVLPAILYGEAHPYGRPFSGTGSEDTVRGLTRDDLVATHRTWFRPDNAEIFASSDLPLARLLPLLEARFGRWQAPPTPRGVKRFTAAVPAGGSRIVLIDRPQSPQSLIFAGQLLPVRGVDDTLALETANEVLSADFLARLNQDLRETRGWSYGVFGFVQPVQERMPLFLQAPVQTDQTGPSIQAIIDQVRAFVTDRGVTPAELQRVVQGNSRELAGSFETSQQLLGALRTISILRRPDDHVERLPARYRSMTTAELDAAARRAIDPARLVFVVVGDASAVRPQLERIGLPIEVVQPR